VNYTIPTPLACNGCIFEGMNFQALGANDIDGTDGTTQNKYILNVCGSVETDSYCLQVSSLTSACVVNAAGQTYSVGEYNPQQAYSQWFYTNASNPAAGVTLQLNGAQQCYASGTAQDWITEINVSRNRDHCWMSA
jgi:hypothetical protein